MEENNPNPQSKETESITRRGYIVGATTALGTGAMLAGASTGARAAEYDEIVLDPGEKWRYTMSQGETLENLLIDISADGAGVEINATGVGGWTIRNIGFKGPDSGENEKFMIGPSVPAGETGVIENVYIGDGDEYGLSGGGEAPIYVYPGHAGTLEIRNVYMEGHGDNGLYASGPGHNGAGGGEVHVYDSYSGNNYASNIRLGTDGSFIDNCCIWGGPHRGFWGYFEHTEVRNSHVGGGLGGRAVEAGEPAWDKAAHAEITVINSQIEGTNTRESTNAVNVDSNSGYNPQEFVPSGCPTSAEEAAGGGHSDSESPEDSEPTFPADEHLVAFVTEPDANLAAYEFFASGPVEFAEAPYESPSGGNIVGGTYTAEDFIEEHDDHWRAGGITGGGHGDAFLVDGPITDVTLDQPDGMWIELNGEEVSEEELIERTGGNLDDEEPDGTDLIAFITTPEAEYAEYELAIEGELVPTEAPYDSPSGGWIAAHRETVETVDGISYVESLTGGGHGDAYEFDGSIRSITVDQPDVMWVELNGEEVEPEELVDEPMDDPDGESATVSILETSEGVRGGERLDVTAALANEGFTEISEDVSLLVGSGEEEVDSETVTVAAGESKTVTLGYETYPVQQDVEFVVRIESEDDADSRAVSVDGLN